MSKDLEKEEQMGNNNFNLKNMISNKTSKIFTERHKEKEPIDFDQKEEDGEKSEPVFTKDDFKGRTIYYEEDLEDLEFDHTNKILNILTGLVFRPFRLISTFATKMPLIPRRQMEGVCLTAGIFSTLGVFSGLCFNLVRNPSNIFYGDASSLYVQGISSLLTWGIFIYLRYYGGKYYEYDLDFDEGEYIDTVEDDTVEEEEYDPVNIFDDIEYGEEVGELQIRSFTREELKDFDVSKLLDLSIPRRVEKKYEGLEQEVVAREVEEIEESLESTTADSFDPETHIEDEFDLRTLVSNKYDEKELLEHSIEDEEDDNESLDIIEDEGIYFSDDSESIEFFEE